MNTAGKAAREPNWGAAAMFAAIGLACFFSDSWADTQAEAIAVAFGSGFFCAWSMTEVL